MSEAPSATRSTRRRTGLLADTPSILFLLGVIANTALIASIEHTGLQALAAMLQALLLMGCQEAKHQAVHRNFLSNHRANDAVGILCAALVGVNFIAYRYFHLKHHQAPCTDGRLGNTCFLRRLRPPLVARRPAPLDRGPRCTC